MHKTFAAAASVAAVLLTLNTAALAAPPPGAGHRPPSHYAAIASSQRVHVGSSQRMHTPTGNRVRMTPAHGQMGPVGGRMSSLPNVHRQGGPGTATVHVGPPPTGPRYDRNYVRPSLAPRYYRPLPPPPPSRWRYAGYYGRPYGYYSSVWYGYPPAYYGYPYGVYYGGYYVRPGVVISVRI